MNHQYSDAERYLQGGDTSTTVYHTSGLETGEIAHFIPLAPHHKISIDSTALLHARSVSFDGIPSRMLATNNPCEGTEFCEEFLSKVRSPINSFNQSIRNPVLIVYRFNEVGWVSNRTHLEASAKTLPFDSYCSIDEAEILDYLKDKPETLKLLLEAISEVKAVFGENVHLTLKLMDEPESDDGGFHLAVRIINDLEVREARKKLKQFNRGWWFKQNPEFFGKVAFGLEFK